MLARANCSKDFPWVTKLVEEDALHLNKFATMRRASLVKNTEAQDSQHPRWRCSPNQWNFSYFQFLVDTLIQKTHCLIIKINSCRGYLHDISADKASLHLRCSHAQPADTSGAFFKIKFIWILWFHIFIFLILQINNFRADLTDMSARKSSRCLSLWHWTSVRTVFVYRLLLLDISRK